MSCICVLLLSFFNMPRLTFSQIFVLLRCALHVFCKKRLNIYNRIGHNDLCTRSKNRNAVNLKNRGRREHNISSCQFISFVPSLSYSYPLRL